MQKKLVKLLVLVICFALLIPSLVACSQGENRDFYIVTFKVTDGADRLLLVEKDGVIGESFEATRVGYTINGWYTDELLSKEFDFGSPITSDITLYGKWKRNPEQYVVTFDLGLAQDENEQIAVQEGTAISQKSLPECKKLGYNYRQWFVDEQKTIAWDFENDVVTEDMTLYADYVDDPALVKDSEGNIQYENVTVSMYANWVFGTADLMQQIVNEFNEEYNGKIKVIISNSSLNSSTQKDYALRYQQIPEVNKDAQMNYYPAESVLSLAGVSWDKTEWYENATRNCYINNKLYSVPIAGAAPFLVYNKSLMSKYNGANALPTNFSQLSTLLKSAYAGEASNSSFKSILSATGWQFKEASSMMGVLQNGAQYYYLQDGKFVNDWGENTSPIYKGAATGLSNMYSLFGANGDSKGGTSASEWDSYTAVKNSNALCAMINTPEFASQILQDSSVGVLPMSGLLAGDGVDSSIANQVPVHTVGLQFYKAANVDVVELAAAGVFADYASKKTIKYGQAGWFPLYKEIVESSAFKAYDVNKLGDPNNFRTMDGCSNEKNIVNAIAAESYMISLLGMSSVTQSTAETQVYDLLSQIKAYLF